MVRPRPGRLQLTDSVLVVDDGRCDSCGSDGVEVLAVHRVYVTPEAWDTEGKVEVLDEVERWCFPCRTSYPHEELPDS